MFHSLIAPTFSKCSQLLRNGRLLHSSSRCLNQDKFYKILGVSNSASKDEIKSAYFKLSKTCHPDHNKTPEAKQMFSNITEAYETLVKNLSQEPKSEYNFWKDDIEDDFYKDFDKQAEKQPNFINYRITLNLTFGEALMGCVKPMKIKIRDTCPSCGGTMCQNGTKMKRCPICYGTGMESIRRHGVYLKQTCHNCKGLLYVNPNPCGECEGVGTTIQRKTTEIPVPPGTRNLQETRFKINKKTFIIQFKVLPDKRFRTHGPDIHVNQSISLPQAILGGMVPVYIIHDRHIIDIEPGTSSKTRVRMPKKGLPRSSTTNGDLYVHFKIRIPEKLTKEQELIMRAFAETEFTENGTVEGMAPTPDGNKPLKDDDPKVKLLRDLLQKKDKYVHIQAN